MSERHSTVLNQLVENGFWLRGVFRRRHFPRQVGEQLGAAQHLPHFNLATSSAPPPPVSAHEGAVREPAVRKFLHGRKRLYLSRLNRANGRGRSNSLAR